MVMGLIGAALYLALSVIKTVPAEFLGALAMFFFMGMLIAGFLDGDITLVIAPGIGVLITFVVVARRWFRRPHSERHRKEDVRL